MTLEQGSQKLVNCIPFDKGFGEKICEYFKNCFNFNFFKKINCPEYLFYFSQLYLGYRILVFWKKLVDCSQTRAKCGDKAEKLLTINVEIDSYHSSAKYIK